MLKTSELTGAQLDYWVARAEGYHPWFTRLAPDAAAICTIGVWHDDGAVTAKFYRPSTDWTQGGPLIEVWRSHPEMEGTNWNILMCCDTPLQAICRAVVRAAFGDEVEEVPTYKGEKS